jgi:hypothetical protein
VSEKRLPYFKVGKELKELVNRGPAPLQGGADPYRDSGVMNEGDKDGG